MKLLALLPAAAALAAPAAAQAPPKVDPRLGGLTLGMGEWSVVPEAPSIRPGRVTFLVRNSGKVVHGFRIKQETDSHGGDRIEARTRLLKPGESTRLTVELPAGNYSIECYVEGHDNLGMERPFRVSPTAPFVAPAPRTGTVVRIQGFAFAPGTLRARVGTTIRWTNTDPAPHTVSAPTGSFDSGTLTRGETFTRRFAKAGTFSYLCALHPRMKGRVVVAG
jgi:plastocyanin